MRLLVFTSPTYSDFASDVISATEKEYPYSTFAYSSFSFGVPGDIGSDLLKQIERFDGFVFLIHDGERRSDMYDRFYQTVAGITKPRDKFLYVGIVTDVAPTLLDVPGTIHFFHYPIKDVSDIVETLLQAIEYSPSKIIENGFIPELVEPAKKLLSQLGYYSGDFTGEVDDHFIKEVMAYKTSRNLSSPQILDVPTLEALRVDVAEKRGKEDWDRSKKNTAWVLKYTSSDFRLENIKEGDVVTLNYGPDFPGNTKIKISELSLKDLILGYDPSKAAIQVRFTPKSFGPDEIQLIVKEIYPKEIPLKILRVHPEFAVKLISSDTGKLFIADKYNQIDLTKLISTFLERPERTLDNETSYASDLNFSETPDQLDFLNDVEAFANIISLRKVNPPLAIGLFGHWGSGKSFFMDKLSERITFNSQKKENKFLKHIVQVKFNSWHYSDGNLWASLISHIFESLNDYATRKKFGKELISKIYSKLSITNVQLSETQLKIEAKETEVANLELHIKQVDDTIKDKKSRLDSLTVKDYFSIALKDPEISAELSRLKSNYIPGKVFEDTNQIIETAEEYQDFFKQIDKTIELFQSNKGWRWAAFWLFLLLLAALLTLLNFTSVFNWISAKARPIFGWIASIAVVCAGAREQLKPYYKDVKLFYKRMNRFKELAIAKQNAIKLSEEEEKERLEVSLSELTLQKQALELERTQKTSEKQALENHLQDISSGKMLSSFFAEKSADENYAKHLGIVSWVRKDFSMLSDLLAQQAAVNEAEGNIEGQSEVGKIKVDRIVLFIDDLDRCSGKAVVKMLEAIHLLLAFELFVVVVGVDPRWLNNALDSQFGNFFGKSKDSNDDKPSKSVTSYDYLEKIFQIPFALKPINNAGRSKLISFLTIGDLENNKEPGSGNTEPQNILRVNPSGGDTGNDQADLVFSTNEDLPPVVPGLPIVDFMQGNRIVLSSEEISFMQSVVVNFDTPRTIKRFVNIYRLIKAHRSYKFIAGTQKMDFVPTMVLLSVIVGCPDSARTFIVRLRDENIPLLLTEFIETFQDKSLTEFFSKINSPEVQNLVVAEVRENLDLISRFSFRTYLT